MTRKTSTQSDTVSALEALMARIAELEAKLDAVPTAKRSRVKAKPQSVAGTESKATVLVGTRPGYIQLQFDGKPTDSVRDALKARGYRWNRVTGLWWGKSEAFPKAKVGGSLTIR
jgi:hypothetical protein